MRREMGGLEKGHTLGRDGAGQRLLGAVGFPRLQWSCARQQRVAGIADSVSGLPPVEEMDTYNMLAQSLVQRGGPSPGLPTP